MELICKEMVYGSKLYNEHIASQCDFLSAKYSALGQFFLLLLMSIYAFGSSHFVLSPCWHEGLVLNDCKGNAAKAELGKGRAQVRTSQHLCYIQNPVHSLCFYYEMKHLIRAGFLRWCQITQQKLNPEVSQVPDVGISKMFIILMGWYPASSYRNLNSPYSPLWAQYYFARGESGICEISGKRWCCSIS